MNIHLCQLPKHSYNTNDLLKLNVNKTENVPNKIVRSALESFNLFKSPFAIETEVPTTDACRVKRENKRIRTVDRGNKYKKRSWINDTKNNLNRMELNLKKDESEFDEIAGIIDITEERDLDDIDEMILLVCAVGTNENENKYNINEKLDQS